MAFLLKRFACFPLGILFGVSCFAEVDHPVIGYGYATSVLPAKNQEAFINGFELGFKHILGADMYRKLVTIERDSSGSQLGALKALSRLKQANVNMIVGFPTSHEALQVSDVTVKENLLTIFISAGHSKLSSMGPYIMTTGESMRSYVLQTLDFLKKRFPHKKGLFVYNPTAVFSVNQKEEFERVFSEHPEFKNPFKQMVTIDSSRKVNEATIDAIKAKEFDYIFVTMYPDESFPLVSEQFTERKIDLPIITNSSWTTGDIEFVRRAISEKKAPLITSAVWIPGSPESRSFETLVKTKYGINPSTDVANGFDLGIICSTVIQRAKGNYSKQSLYEAFSSDRCFRGVSIGKICFPKNGGNGDGKLKFRYLTKNGLAPIQ